MATGFHQEMSEQEVASTRPVLPNLYLQARGQRLTGEHKASLYLDFNDLCVSRAQNPGDYSGIAKKVLRKD